MFQTHLSSRVDLYLTILAAFCSLLSTVSGVSLDSWPSNVENNTRADRQLLGSWQQSYPQYSAALGQRYPYQPWNSYSDLPFDSPASLESHQRSRPGMAASRAQWVAPDGTSTCFPPAIASLLNPFATTTTAKPSTTCPTAATCSYKTTETLTACTGFAAPTEVGTTRKYKVTTALTGTISAPAAAATDVCYLYITVVPPYKRVRVTCTIANGVRVFGTTSSTSDNLTSQVMVVTVPPTAFFSGSSGTIGLRFDTSTGNFVGGQSCTWTAIIIN